MFYIWHTLIIATFIAMAYQLGIPTWPQKSPSQKKPYVKVRLVPEDPSMKDHAFYYYAMKPGKGEKQNQKLRMRKFDPITQKHIWWVEKKLPPHSK
jgi:large subunit ribosomal protein L33